MLILIGLSSLCLVSGRDFHDYPVRDFAPRSRSGSAPLPLDVGDSPNGPYNWYKTFPLCGSDSQSPIALGRPDKVAYVPRGENNYNIPKEMELVGTDTFLELSIFDDINKPIPDDVYFNTTERFKLEKVHIIWSMAKYFGSEHSVNGVHYPIELQFIFIDQRFRSPAEATPHPGARMVNSIFLRSEKNAKDSRQFEKMLEGMRIINGTSKAVPINFVDEFPMWQKFRADDYYTYQGSFTFPPCLDAICNVFLSNLVISERQVEEVRYMRRSDGSLYTDLVRPIQPLNQRKVTYVTRVIKHSDQREDEYQWEGSNYETVDGSRPNGYGQIASLGDFDFNSRRYSDVNDDHRSNGYGQIASLGDFDVDRPRYSGHSMRHGDFDRFSSWDDDHFGDDWRHGDDDWGHGELRRISSWDDDHLGDDWRHRDDDWGHGGPKRISSWDDFDGFSPLEDNRVRHHGMYDDFHGLPRSAGRNRGRFADLSGARHRPGHGYERW